MFAQHSVAGFPLIDDQSGLRGNINEYARFRIDTSIGLTVG
jgi:hypothetical protein